jgi:hypothetical protein
VAAFFYLRVALLMYSSDPAEGPSESPILGTEGPEEDSALTAGLQPIASLDSPAGPIGLGGTAPATMTATTPSPVVTLEAPPAGPVEIPPYVGLVLVISVAFTIFAGVSSPIITLARQATMLF